jgi:hypothetical protein
MNEIKSKSMKKFIVLFVISAVCLSASAQAVIINNNSNNGTQVITPKPKKDSGFGVAIGASASTHGLGGNVIIGLTKWLSVRGSYEMLNNELIADYVPTNFQYAFNDDLNLDITPTFKTGGYSVMADLYLGRSLYVTGGFVQTVFDANATVKSAESMKIGDITFTPDEIGKLEVQMKPGKTPAPYLGIGLGRNIARKSGLAMTLEFGAIMMESYNITLNGTGMFGGNSQNASFQKLIDTVNGFDWAGVYPVVKLGISYRLF